MPKQSGRFYFKDGECLVKPDCPECPCSCKAQGKHPLHKGPIFDTGYGCKECEACGQVTDIYAPI